MTKQTGLFFLIFFVFLNFFSAQKAERISVEKFGIYPDTKQNYGAAYQRMMDFIQNRKNKTPLQLYFPKGRYDFFENQSFTKEYYISNHDQVNPKHVGLALENLKHVTIEGNGSEFIFHGRMLPLSVVNSDGIHLKDFSVDFEVPALRQIKILTVNKDHKEVTAEIFPKGNYKTENNRLVILGENFEVRPEVAMVFEPSRRLAYKRRDVAFNPQSVEEIAPDTFRIRGWDQALETSVGEVFVLRSYERPNPGIFISTSRNMKVENVNVHYAEGMGLLAQMTENITLDGFKVALRGKEDPRFFTTQADATHFSGCKGKIISRNGLYEGMADDAINVHGTYLKILKVTGENSIQARYMHQQSWGFDWGYAGDEVHFLESGKMENVGGNYKIKTIQAVDKPSAFGARIFEITLDKKLPQEISDTGKFAVENLTWTPTVVFENSMVRNNRARGALFSTPQKVICQNNIFDHTHGTAILLAGDANGWYETGACKDVLIRNNKFLNALTATYQFTNAIISIYPEIPDLAGQKQFFHSGIVIENNLFETFDRPLLYAKSVSGLIFRNNKILHNKDYPAFHENHYPFFFEKVEKVLIKDNYFDTGFNPSTDILLKYSQKDAVKVE